MNKYTFIIKEGTHKNHIIDWTFAPSRKQAEDKMKQTLKDCRVLAEAGGIIYQRNYRIQTEKDV